MVRRLFMAPSKPREVHKPFCSKFFPPKVVQKFVHQFVCTPFFRRKTRNPERSTNFFFRFFRASAANRRPEKKFVRRFVCAPLLLGKPKFRQVPELCSACFSISPHGKDLESIKRQFVDLPLSLEKFRWVTKMCVSVFLGFMARQRLRKSSNAHVSMCRLLYKKRASRWQLVIFIRSQSPRESAWQLFASRLL